MYLNNIIYTLLTKSKGSKGSKGCCRRCCKGKHVRNGSQSNSIKNYFISASLVDHILYRKYHSICLSNEQIFSKCYSMELIKKLIKDILE